MSYGKTSPFVKWAGGKTQLLEQLKNRLPDSYETFYEPFIGGGALLLSIQPKKAIINDSNEQLINAFKQLKYNTDSVINIVKDFNSKTCNKEYYLQLRERYNKKIASNELDAECAALMIWINKHCFNGLYRVNSKGLFNVPYNNSTTVKTISEENLINIGRYLTENDVKIRLGDFEAACFDCSKGDFVYLDSPYIPVSKTAYFTDYTKDGFTYDDHKRLSKLFRALDKKGIKVMLSNNDVPLAYELYDGFNIENVDVRRNINSNANKRTGKEVIITNY